MFNIFLADLFFILNDVDIASYADDNIPYVIADDISGVITSLGKASKALFEWFENNLLKSNAGKCHLLVSSSDAVYLRVSEYDIKNSECEKLLGAKFENKLILHKKIVTFTICDLILSFPDLLVVMHFTGPKLYPILVQLSGIFFLIVTKTYQNLMFLKTGLKNGNLKIVPADFAKHTFIDLAINRLSLRYVG